MFVGETRVGLGEGAVKHIYKILVPPVIPCQIVSFLEFVTVYICMCIYHWKCNSPMAPHFHPCVVEWLVGLSVIIS